MACRSMGDKIIVAQSKKLLIKVYMYMYVFLDHSLSIYQNLIYYKSIEKKQSL